MSDQAATIVVEQVGPYGVKASGVWFGLTSRLGITPKQFIVGRSYQVTLYYSQSGKGYISGVTAGQLNSPKVPAAHASAPAPTVTTTPAPAVGAPPPPPPLAAPAKPPFRAGGFQRPAKGGESQADYEKRQALIIRQSCLSTAAEIVKGDSDVDHVLAVAERLEAWVNR